MIYLKNIKHIYTKNFKFSLIELHEGHELRAGHEVRLPHEVREGHEIRLFQLRFRYNIVICRVVS